jgi:uncharacterized protein (DUF983 family)
VPARRWRIDEQSPVPDACGIAGILAPGTSVIIATRTFSSGGPSASALVIAAGSNAEARMAHQHLRPANAVLTGLKARCPRCGEGTLFRSGLVLREKCPRCGLNYAFADSGDGPAVFAIFILGFFVLGGALLVEFRLGPPWWVHVVLWAILTPVLAFGLLRGLKGVLIGLQYKHQAGEGRLGPD